MRIIDRYILVSFLKNYLIAFAVLVGMYIVLDLVFNFDDLTSVQNTVAIGGSLPFLSVLANIANFYFYRTFEFYEQLSGIIPVAAAAFTLVRLSRFNELVAVLAAGVPLLRLAVPVVLAGVVLNGLLVADQELVIPSIIPQLTRKHDDLRASATYPIRAMQDSSSALIYGGRYHPPTARTPAFIEQLDVIYRDRDLMPVAHLQADRADYDAALRQWTLTNGRIVRNLLPEQHPSGYQPVNVYKSNLTPEEIALFNSSDSKIVRYISTARINQLLRRSTYGTTDLLRTKHARFTQPIVNIILLLLAIPCVLTREPWRIKANALRLLVLLGLCLGAFFVAYNLAGNPPAGRQWTDLWPALMAWLPVFIFGPLSVFLLERVKT